MQIDPVVRQFTEVYGVRNLIESMGLEKIRKTGDYFMALCPFHENTREPDFQIHKSLGLFNCFGCSAKGNLYQLVKEFYNISYKEADSFIQKLAGFDESVNIEDIRFRVSLRNMFASSDEDNKPKVRKFTEKDLIRFKLQPDPTNYLLGRGYTHETIDYFECSYTERWAVWDEEAETYTYQKRVVIPGHLDDGKICGVIGRTVENAEPKYKYTASYPKSTSLFNLHRAKKHGDAGLILVEGALDVMRIHQFGFSNVVGIYGATVHEQQAELVLQYTDKVYLMFDNDEAGRKAMESGIDAFKDKVDLNIVPLASFKDPGEIPNADTLKTLLGQSLNWFRYVQETSYFL